MKSAPILANQPIDITIPALPAQPSLETSSQLRLCRYQFTTQLHY